MTLVKLWQILALGAAAPFVGVAAFVQTYPLGAALIAALITN